MLLMPSSLLCLSMLHLVPLLLTVIIPTYMQDVGTTVLKSRETSAVYMRDDGSIFTCSKTEDEGSIYAVRRMRACNNNNMRNPIIKRCREGLRLLHATTPYLIAYILPSSSVLLHVNILFGERHCTGQKEADLCRNEGN